jgi:hypothetical protein
MVSGGVGELDISSFRMVVEDSTLSVSLSVNVCLFVSVVLRAST